VLTTGADARTRGRRRALGRPRTALVAVASLLAAALVALLAIRLAPTGEASRPPAVVGYMAPWSSANGLASLDRATSKLTEISPVWYVPDAAGQVVLSIDDHINATVREPTRAKARSAHLRLTPTISNYHDGSWDGELVARLVGPGQRDEHVDHIVKLVAAEGYDGIDIDYESLPDNLRTSYTSFLSLLAEKLHAQHKRLSVAVPAKTAEPGPPGTRAMDYRAIGRVVDQLRVMTYDYSWTESPPGPVAPIRWVRQVLDFALAEVDRDRILLGIGTYGYDWTEGADQAEVLTWVDIQRIAAEVGASPDYHKDTQSPSFSFVRDGRRHTVWFENDRSAAAKMALARQRHVQGVHLWKLGGEDPALWQSPNDH
jgi:spore germination protein